MNYIIIIFSFILSYNNIQFDTSSSSNINMDLNEVISGNLDYSLTLQGEEYESLVAVKYMYGYEESDGIVFLKSDNSLWVISRNTRNISVKTAENVNSVKSFSQLQYAAILKNDNSVWVATAHSPDGIYFFKKIFKNAIMIDIKKGGDALYILKKDNSLWSYKSENDKLSKIIDDAAWAAVQDDKGAFIDTDGNLYYWDCDNIKSKQDMIFLTDNVKDIAFRSVVGLMDLLDSKIFTGSSKFRDKNGFFELDLIKNDGSLWRYLPEGEQRESYKYSKIEKLGDWTFE